MAKIEVPYVVPNDGEAAAFFLIHGAWHRAACWDMLRSDLEGRGYPTEAPDLPSDDPDKTFDDDAEVVVKSIEDSGAETAIMVAHSRAGNVAIRAANEIERRMKLGQTALQELRIIHLASAVDLKMAGWQFNSPGGLAKASIGRQGIEKINGRTSELDVDSGEGRKLVKFTFYHDCNRQVARKAMRQLRPQRLALPEREGIVEQLPEAPSEYIFLKNDRVIFPEWQQYMARDVLKVSRIWSLESGHSVMFSRPQELADTLAWRAEAA